MVADVAGPSGHVKRTFVAQVAQRLASHNCLLLFVFAFAFSPNSGASMPSIRSGFPGSGRFQRSSAMAAPSIVKRKARRESPRIFRLSHS